jgi:hypothetical protein
VLLTASLNQEAKEMDQANLRQMAIATFSQVGIQLDEANVKAEIDDNWFLGGLEPTNQLYFVHLLVDGQGREEPGRHGWVEFNWKGEVLPLGAAGTG